MYLFILFLTVEFVQATASAVHGTVSQKVDIHLYILTFFAQEMKQP